VGKLVFIVPAFSWGLWLVGGVGRAGRIAAPAGQERNPQMAAIPITARGAEMLKAELVRLKSIDRPGVIQAIKEAREKGDLSENAEYDAARERQGFIEGRIQELEGKLSSLQIIDPAAVDAGERIVFGAKVELEEVSSGNRVEYQIVGDDEADIKSGLISVSSPTARALIGKSIGDVATVVAPGGKREYEILDVRYR
jgi:transcription elongation factor GreA